MSHQKMSRRSLIKVLTSAAVVPAISMSEKKLGAQEAIAEQLSLQGNIPQSVSYWCFGHIPLEKFADICKKLGLVGIDLLAPDQWKVLAQKEMIVTMGNVPGATIETGFNHVENHDKLVECYEKTIPLAAQAHVPNLICFSGNRKGIGEEEGLENCVKGLQRVIPIAEKHGVTLQMELLNSIGHKDYQADHTAWAAEIARRLSSERFKLLYDIYHMQIMEGNLIDTIKANADVIGHYHTGGNPGRAEIDDTQEICYPPIIRAILETGFKGFLAHEFVPKREDKIGSLEQAIRICDV